MKVGVSQIDITPAPGVELSGFAIRTQPSTGVLDSLFAKSLYLEDGDECLLWVHCDVIGFDEALVTAFRRKVTEQWGLDESRIMLSATHTHAGPATIHLRECGEYDSDYAGYLLECLCRGAAAALSRTETCSLVAVEAPLALAIDRRRKADAHTDPRVGATGFRRGDGTWLAVLVNYAVHPVALGPASRQISADISGQAAAALARTLPGKPVVLVTNGACGNLNPPAVGVSFSQVTDWGNEIAAAVAGPLKLAPLGISQGLRAQKRRVSLPLDVLRDDALDDYVQRSLQTPSFQAAWGEHFRRAVEHWGFTQRWADAAGTIISTRDVELMAIALGDVILIGVNAEVFSRFTHDVRRASGRLVYTVGYANGVLGYLPTREAFVEGGYEVDAAHFFYGGFRFKPGSLEQLAQEAVVLVTDLAGNRKEKSVA